MSQQQEQASLQDGPIVKINVSYGKLEDSLTRFSDVYGSSNSVSESDDSDDSVDLKNYESSDSDTDDSDCDSNYSYDSDCDLSKLEEKMALESEDKYVDSKSLYGNVIKGPILQHNTKILDESCFLPLIGKPLSFDTLPKIPEGMEIPPQHVSDDERCSEFGEHAYEEEEDQFDIDAVTFNGDLYYSGYCWNREHPDEEHVYHRSCIDYNIDPDTENERRAKELKNMFGGSPVSNPDGYVNPALAYLGIPINNPERDYARGTCNDIEKTIEMMNDKNFRFNLSLF